MPGPLLPTSGNGIARREQSTPSLRIPGPRTEAGRAIMRSHSDLRNLALAAADDDIEERPHRPVAAQAPSAAPPTQQAPIIPHPHPTPLSASAIFQGRVERWISALDLLERTRRLEAEQADVAAATAGMQAMALDSGSPSVGFAPAPIQASPRLPMGCDECYDGGVMPCPECEEAMNLAASGCRCEPGGITSCDHPHCKAEEYDQEDQDEEMADGDASEFDNDYEDGEDEYEV